MGPSFLVEHFDVSLPLSLPILSRKRREMTLIPGLNPLLGDSLSLPPKDPPSPQLELHDFSATDGDVDFDPDLATLPFDDDPVTDSGQALR